MTALLETIAIVGLIGYVIVRQLLGEPIRAKRLIVLPGVLALVGFLDLRHGPHVGSTDVVLIVVGGLIAAGIGVAQGAWMHLEQRNGFLWGKLPRRSIWLWVALYASRGALIGLAYGFGAHVAGASSADLLILGVNRLAQAAVVGLRARVSGIPLAPETGGGRLLGSQGGHADQRPPSTSTEGEIGTLARPTPASKTVTHPDQGGWAAAAPTVTDSSLRMREAAPIGAVHSAAHQVRHEGRVRSRRRRTN